MYIDATKFDYSKFSYPDAARLVERVGDFIKLLKEAEFTYALGAYTSTIAMVGVCAEDLCRFFADSAGHNMDNSSQYERVRALHRLNLPESYRYGDSNQHRLSRNRVPTESVASASAVSTEERSRASRM